MVCYEIQQNQTSQPLEFLLVQPGDHITGATGLTPVVTLSKNGGAFTVPAGLVTETGNGWYKVAGNATDSNTLGPLKLHVAASAGNDPADYLYPVVAYNPQSSTAFITGINSLTPPTNWSLQTIDVSGSVTVGTFTAAAQTVLANAIWNALMAGYTVANSFGAYLQGLPSASTIAAAVWGAVTRTITAFSNVIVGGYATGQDPATLLLKTPANLLATDSSGHVTVGSYPGNTPQTADVATAITDIIALSTKIGTPAHSTIAGDIAQVDSDVMAYGNSISAYLVGLEAIVAAFPTTVSIAAAILKTPANLLVTDTSGRITVGTNSDKTGYSLLVTPPTTVQIAAAILATPGNLLLTDTEGRVTVGTNADKIGYSLTTDEHGNVTADVVSGLTEQGYTTLRAGNLDNLNVTISSRLPTSGYLLPDNTDVETLLSQVGTLLSLVNVAISSRLAASAYVAPDNASIEALVTTIATLSGQITNIQSVVDTNLDVPVSTRESGTGDGDQSLLVTVVDDVGAPVPNLVITLWNQDATTVVAAPELTNPNGQVQFFLAAASYQIYVRSTVHYESSVPTTVTVPEDPTITISLVRAPSTLVSTTSQLPPQIKRPWA